MVLENKLSLTNSADLAREEERISKTKAVKMFETGFLDELEALKHYLKFINIYLKKFTPLQEKSVQKISQKGISVLPL